MKLISASILGLVCGLVFLTGCQDQTIVGYELVQGESLNVEYCDTFGLKAKTIESDYSQLATYRQGTNSQTLLIGHLDDPYFGKTSSQAFMETRIYGVTSLPDYTGATFDSLVLVLSLDTLGTYGDVGTHDIEVYRVIEDMQDIDTVYANQSFETEMTPIGVRNNVTINAKDSTTIINHSDGEEIVLEPQLRIKLNEEFGQMLLADTNAVKSDTLFTEFLSGINIRSKNANNSMFGIDVNSDTSGDFQTALVMYYTIDTVKYSYQYYVGLTRSSYITQDISGTPVESSLDDYTQGEEQVYIQSNLGTNIEFDLSTVMSYSDKLINKVELDIYMADLPGDDLDKYYPCEDIIASSRDENGNLSVVQDVELAISASSTTSARRLIYGGYLEEVELNGITVKRYTVNLTKHIHYLHDNPTEPQNIVFTVLSRAERPTRSILYGPGHAEYPAKLKVTYTNP